MVLILALSLVVVAEPQLIRAHVFDTPAINPP
jgi:hypothetical protein